MFVFSVLCFGLGFLRLQGNLFPNPKCETKSDEAAIVLNVVHITKLATDTTETNKVPHIKKTCTSIVEVRVFHLVFWAWIIVIVTK
jgi:hypothetical protein